MGKTREDFETESAFLTYQITHPEEFEEHKEDEKTKKEIDEYGIFVCLNCGEIIDETETKPDKNLKYSERLKCPKCGRKKFKKISKEKKEKLLLLKKKKEKEEKDSKIQIAKENIKDDIIDLIKDLEIRLEQSKISSAVFVSIAMNLSYKIFYRYGKDLDLPWTQYRKNMLEMCNSSLQRQSVSEDAEKILEEYDENIEENKLYKAELDYYINDISYSIPEYEYNEKIEEYNKIDSEMKDKEAMKKIEERYQEHLKFMADKANRREQRRIERNLVN